MKKLILPITLILLFGLSAFVYAATIEKKNGDYEVAIGVEQGWNLVAGTVPNDGILSDSTIKLSNIKAVWYYSPLQKKYIQVHPNTDWENINKDDEDFVLSNAMWLYSDKSGLLKYSTLEDYPSDERQLYAGWNFVSITPDFTESGKYPDVTLEELSGNCNIEKAYYFTNGNWVEFNMPEMDSSLSGRGLVIKVTQNCKMEYTNGGISPPPPLPNGGTTGCTDTDGGKNYNIKGTTTGPQGSNIVTKTDSCLNNNQVGEWFCWPSDNHVEGTTYTCPNGCSNGACL